MERETIWVREGLLTDQVHVTSALIWAHAATGQLPYSMLAAELMQFASGECGMTRQGSSATAQLGMILDVVRTQLPCGLRAAGLRC